MTRTQIQLPDPLHQRLKEIAKDQDWSLAEVIRRASELYVRRFPADRDAEKQWSLPTSLDLGEMTKDSANFRSEADAIETRNQDALR